MLDFGDTSTHDGFLRLFRTVVLKAAYVTAQRLQRFVPRHYTVEVIGGRAPGAYDDLADAAEALRVQGGYYRTIDVAVADFEGKHGRVIARVSDATVCAFEATHNSPRGYGPFRLVRHEALARG
jgi:hypothetical protein